MRRGFAIFLIATFVSLLVVAYSQKPQEDQAYSQKPPEDQQTEADYVSTDYVSKVGDIQAKVVETFSDSHDRLVPYDALTADDVEKMQANQAALQGFTNQVDDLDPPQKYREHYDVFRSAINELYEATKLAHSLAADHVAVPESGFDE